MIQDYKRGDIVWYKNVNSSGSVQSGTRPWLIISNDVGNRFSPTVILAAITSQVKKEIPTHFPLSTDCGLDKPSTVLMEQIATASKRELIGVAGHVDMTDVDKALAISVGLQFVS